MQLYLATTNINKIKEIKNFLYSSFKTFHNSSPFKKQILKTHFFVKSLEDLRNYKSVEETGSSFKENASLKSRHLLNQLKEMGLFESPLSILAEDSGLEVKSLSGAPGIYSARYSGFKANDKKNNELLLKNLKGQKNRKARYVCALSFLFIKGSKVTEKLFEAYCEGKIGYEERGKGGFGYDPVFIPKGGTKTFGELDFQGKQELSHRKKALQKWKGYMEAQQLLRQ